MIKLHHLGTSRSSRVIWLCEEAGIDYELVTHERDPQSFRSPQSLRDVHPLAKAPTVEVDGHTIVESGAILEYLVEAHSDGALGVAPGHAERARYLEWLHFAEGMIGMTFLIPSYGPRIGMPEEQLAQAKAQADMLQTYVEQALEGREYLVAGKLTAADINLHYQIEWRDQGGFLDNSPNLKRFHDALKARPAYQKTVELGGPVLMGG